MAPSHADMRPAFHGNLLVRTTTTFQDTLRTLRAGEDDSESKAFYAIVTAYSALIRDRAMHSWKAGIEIDEALEHRILRHFATAVVASSFDPAQTRVPITVKLELLNNGWAHTLKSRTESAISYARGHLFFGNSKGERNDFSKTLAALEEEMQAHIPEDPFQSSTEDSMPRAKSREPSYAVCNSARSAFKALVACQNCPCVPIHNYEARLSLCTYRKPAMGAGSDDEVDFAMFLSLKHDWHEARVHVAKDHVVQWADVGTQSAVLHGGRPKERSMKVKRLCEPIRKIESMAAHRLEFKVSRGQLFKLRSERTSFLIDRSREVITLDQFLRSGPRSFTERTRRILAIFLAHAVLHLYDTPWLLPTWTSSDVLFFRTTASAIPLMPFIQARLQNASQKRQQQTFDDEEQDPDELDPDDLIQHQCPHLIALAVLLMEVYFVTPFDMLAQRYQVGLTEIGPIAVKYLDAELVFRSCRDEMPVQFRSAVEKCLDPASWEDDNGERLEEYSLRARIFEDIIWPLENELKTAYTTISIDDLDRIAQTMDFNAWDQTLLTTGLQSPGTGSGLPDTQRSASVPPGPFTECSTTSYAQPVYSQRLNLHTKIGQLPVRSIDVDYKGSQFFDDENVFEEQSGEAHARYSTWKQRYEAVYHKYIETFASSTCTKPIKVAILDTGIDLTHPSIEASDENIKGRYNWLNETYPNRVHDRTGHGTFCASLILDYAPDAELYVAKVAEDKLASPGTIAQAINHAVETWEVDIISMSFGFPTCDVEDYGEIEEAIMNAYAKHVLLFAAASNNGGQRGRAYPARDQNVICIHSTDAHGNRSGFSPTPVSDDMNLATVGEGIESAWPVHLCDDVANSRCTNHKSGTSFATPIAVGIAGFLLQYARVHLPALADKMKRQTKMKTVLRRLAEKGSGYEPRDGYQFIDVSLYSDGLFGKKKDYIDEVIGDLLRS